MSTILKRRRLAGALFALAAVACTDPQSDGPLAVEGVESAKPAGGGGSGGTGPTVRSTSPTGSVPGVTLDVRVLGSGYDAGSRAAFALKGVVGPNIVTNSTRFVSSKEVVANITISATADVALYDAIVTTSTGRKGIGTELFEVAYVATDLGTFGGSGGEAVAVNDRNQIAGWSNDRNGWSWPFLWENGRMRKLDPALDGYARDMNENGWVVGQSNLLPFLWTPTGGVEWLPLRAGDTDGAAWAVNDIGQIVGTVNGTSGWTGVMWQGGRIVATFDFAPYAINNAGVVVGSGGFNGKQGSVRWTQAGGMTFLGGTPDGAEALGINEAGEIVGWFSASAGVNEAYLWRDGQRTPLGAVDQGTSVALGISPGGDVITGRSGRRSAVWTNGEAQILGSLRTATAYGDAFDVNSNGWVVGSAGKPVVWKLQAAR